MRVMGIVKWVMIYFQGEELGVHNGGKAAIPMFFSALPWPENKTRIRVGLLLAASASLFEKPCV